MGAKLATLSTLSATTKLSDLSQCFGTGQTDAGAYSQDYYRRGLGTCTPLKGEAYESAEITAATRHWIRVSQTHPNRR